MIFKLKFFLSFICILALVFCGVPVYAAELSVSAKAAVVINADTKEVLYSKNAHSRLSMASTTKIMTALLLAEQNTPDKWLVTTNEMVTVEGSSMGLKAGDTVTYYSLLVGMLLSSGNDAANTTAIALAGSTSKFAEMMNKRATQIGMTNTNFVTPSGLDDENHYSTAFDMALLAAEALKNETFKEVASSSKITVRYGNPPYNRTLTNHNRLLNEYKYCIGVKTGFTKKSGRCLVSAAEKDGCRVIAVTLNDPDDWDDHKKLLDFGLSSVTSCDATYNFENNTVSVVGGDKNRVKVATDSFIYTKTKSSNTDVTAKVSILPFLYADAYPGMSVGFIEYYHGDNLIAQKPIIVIDDSKYLTLKEKSFLDKFKDSFVLILKQIV